MHFTLDQNITVHVLALQPETTIWYAKIPDIFQSICCKATYHTSQPLVNELFQKNDFFTPFLNDAELSIINGFKAWKKQVEWMCGRFLIKQVLQANFLKNRALPHIEIAYQTDGAPIAVQEPDICISLSHSGDYTAAAWSGDPTVRLGVDIEKIGARPDIYFLKTAFTADEIDELPEDAEGIFTRWTVKEAYLKYIQKGFHESLHNVEIKQGKIFHSGRVCDVDISSRRINGYALSLVSGRGPT